MTRDLFGVVRAVNVHIGDVVEHPESHQLGQVGRVSIVNDRVFVLLIDGCRWHLGGDTLLGLHHRPW